MAKHAVQDQHPYGGESVHIVVYEDASLDIYVNPAQLGSLRDGTHFAPAMLADRIEKALRDIAQAGQRKR